MISIIISLLPFASIKPYEHDKYDKRWIDMARTNRWELDPIVSTATSIEYFI